MAALPDFQEPERLSDHEGVVVDGKIRIIERGPHLGRVPEPLMPGPPFSDRAIPLTLADRMSQINIGEADHPHGHPPAQPPGHAEPGNLPREGLA